MAQDRRDVGAFDLVQREGTAYERSTSLRAGNALGERLRLNHRRGPQNHGALDCIAQLAHVARPGVAEQHALADVFFEHAAANAQGAASSIFWPSDFVSSQTLTAELRPGNVSFRLEYRHDQADDAMYFRKTVPTDPTGAFVANARSQHTLTAGMVAWF